MGKTTSVLASKSCKIMILARKVANFINSTLHHLLLSAVVEMRVHSLNLNSPSRAWVCLLTMMKTNRTWLKRKCSDTRTKALALTKMVKPHSSRRNLSFAALWPRSSTSRRVGKMFVASLPSLLPKRLSQASLRLRPSRLLPRWPADQRSSGSARTSTAQTRRLASWAQA